MLKVKIDGTNTKRNKYKSTTENFVDKIDITDDNIIESFMRINNQEDEYDNKLFLSTNNLRDLSTSKKHICTTQDITKMETAIEATVAELGEVQQVIINYDVSSPTFVGIIDRNAKLSFIERNYHYANGNIENPKNDRTWDNITDYYSGKVGTKLDSYTHIMPKYYDYPNIKDGDIITNFPNNIIYRVQPTYLGTVAYDTSGYILDIFNYIKMFEKFDTTYGGFTINNNLGDDTQIEPGTEYFKTWQGTNDIIGKILSGNNSPFFGGSVTNSTYTGNACFKLSAGDYQIKYNINSFLTDKNWRYTHNLTQNKYFGWKSNLCSIVFGYVLYRRTSGTSDAYKNIHYPDDYTNIKDQWRAITLDSHTFRSTKEWENEGSDFSSDNDWENFKEEPIKGNLNGKMLMTIPNDNYEYAIIPLLSNMVIIGDNGNKNIHNLMTEDAVNNGWDDIRDIWDYQSKGQIIIRKVT